MKSALAFGILVAFISSQSLAIKVVMLPDFGRSHFMVLAKLGEELRRRGHEVAIIVGSEATYAVGKPSVKAFKLSREDEELISSHASTVTKFADLPPHQRILTGLPHIGKLQKVYCDYILGTEKSLKELIQADIIVGDSLLLCSALVAAKLDIPHVSVVMGAVATPTIVYYGISPHPAYVPALMSQLPGNMTFLQRVQNTIIHATVGTVMSYLFGNVFRELKDKYKIRPEKTITEALATVDLVLLTKSFALDYAQPIPPYVREVGNFMAAPARALPPELEEFMQESGDEGAIIVSFGSILDSLDDHVVKKMISAFSRLPQRVIWRLNPDKLKSRLPPNIKAVKWLPQNDLLGHNKTMLFFTHGGANGLAEATYHGIPMVCSPMFADQFDNAQIIKHAGIGERLEVKYATVDEMVEAINRVLTEKRFKENSARVSRIQKMRPRLPVEEAADLVEYTQAVGHFDHLKPKGMSLPFYQLYLLDVIAVLVALLGMSIGLIVISCKVVIFMCCKTPKKTKTS